jgi:P27 family predicted phage terminase small subunit
MEASPVPTPRKSEAMHDLTGTKSQAKPEPEYSLPPGRPRYPKKLSLEARRVFKRLCALLEKRRALTEGDGELLRLYSLLYDRHARALAKIEEQGAICTYTRLDSNGQPHEFEKHNLWLKVAETAEKNMVAILDRLGLTPHNRAKVKPTAKPESKKPENEFEEFLSRGGNWVMPAHDEEGSDAGRTDYEA